MAVATPDIVLVAPKILVTQIAASTLGIALQSAEYAFGSVAMVYQGTDTPVVGQTVVFKIKDVDLPFMYGSTLYFQIDANKVSFKENTPP